MRVRWLLETLGYALPDIQSTIAHVAIHGSAECCELALLDGDRIHVEALLPMDVSWSDPRWDAECWTA